MEEYRNHNSTYFIIIINNSAETEIILIAQSMGKCVTVNEYLSLRYDFW